MPEINLQKHDKQALVQKLQHYFDVELGQEIGSFDAEFLLDFFSRELGVYYYNQGLLDAQAVLGRQLDSVAEAVDELLQPTSLPTPGTR